MDNRPRYGSFNRPIPIHLGEFYLVGVGAMTEAARRVLANLIDMIKPVELKQPDGTWIEKCIITVAPVQRDLIVATLRAISQEPIAQRQRETIARIIDPTGFDPDNLAFEPFWIDQ